VGIGNLGRALASYRGFSERGFRITALFDVADDVVGTEVAGLRVRHLDELKEAVAQEGICIGIITTPPSAAQEVAERFVDAGLRSILNFAPAVVNVPPDVSIRKVDLAMELQILSFYQQRTQAIATAREAHRRLEERGDLPR
jgi:redox-sensing transcriptional repressor